MAKGVKDIGQQKLADYHTENNGEPTYKAVPDVGPTAMKTYGAPKARAPASLSAKPPKLKGLK